MKKGLKFILATCTTTLLLFQSGQCQQAPTFDKLVDFLPPAPNAAAITRYGDASVNKNSGTPNISIPLFSVKGSKLSTTVSLGYSSNGIKVDEIASRLGMGWAINAGGVITRSLRGVPDETNNRHYPYATIATNWQTFNYMKRIAESQSTWGYNNGFDAEPDLFNFSFDGYSGSFVFDGAGYVQVNKSGIKVITDFTGNLPWNFKITTPDGTIYLFGGPTATEKTKRDQTCGKSYTQYLATAWYLKEIQHLNGEKIQFTYTAHSYQYDNGVTQTMYDPGLSGLGSGCSCAAIGTSTCVNISNTVGVLLSTIESPGKASVTFDYITREDCNDKLISKITLRDPVNTVSSFDFTYTTVTSSSAYNNEYYLGQNKTPYLTSLTENSSDNTLHKQHYFSYIDPEGRPQRLSFSQDHWGYFNGKVNTSFTPFMGINYAQGFPNATANREPEFAYGKKGLLQKIVYPTGGTTTLFYEPNIVDNGANNSYTTLHKLSCDVTGTGGWVQQTKSKIFHSDINQQVALWIQCRDNSGNGNFDSLHNKGSVQLKDYTTGQIIFNEVYIPGFNATVNTFLPTAGHDYQLILSANGTVVTTLATLNYYPTSNTSAFSGNIAGGIRVQKIATANPGESPMIKRYYYGSLENLNQSSMAYIAKPRYVGYMAKLTACPNPPGGSFVCEYNTLNSSSIFNLGYFNNGLVSYHSVVESIGENFEGGGTESKFYSGTDGLGQVMWNRDIINSPFTNFSSFYNAKPYIETVVKKQTNGSLKPIKKTEYAYFNEPAGENEIFGYTVVERVPSASGLDTTCDLSINPTAPGSCYSNLVASISVYDMIRYSVFSSFVHPVSVTETVYDENGENPVVTVNNSFYENLQHFQLTKSEVTNSKGQLLRTTNKYPHEFTGTQVYNDMVSKNIISSLVNSKSEIVNNPGPNTALSEQQIDYSNTGNFNYVPIAIKKSVKGNSLETEGTIDYYDANGNILQFTNKAAITSAIIWGYNYQYPVAQVVGVTYANAVAQLTGGSVTALQTMDGATLRTELNRIRTNITAASVTSYTYKHLSGVSSITDPNNKTNTYEYDAFNRLILIKDQDGNAVKKNEYVYATPSSGTGLTIYYNQELTQTLQCNTCQAGFTGTSGSYTIPLGKHYSLISLQDANDKAAADMVVNGQEYVNKNGYCSNSASCTGSGYKFVSCGCELGQKICEYSTEDLPNNPGSWFAHLHYQWSDGSTSPSFTDYITGCTGISKKFINCACETGVKVCDNVTNNGGGSYTVTYHYHFSDNTNSSTVNETITCSGPDKKMIGCTCETGMKIYTASVYDLKGNLGCTPHMWLCTYHYHWSDGSNSPDYTECAAATCIE